MTMHPIRRVCRPAGSGARAMPSACFVFGAVAGYFLWTEHRAHLAMVALCRTDAR